MKFSFKEISSIEDLKKCFPLLLQLRPHLTEESFFKLYEEAHKLDGYRIVVLEQDHQFLALMGYRWTTDFIRGRHIYIDDLVTDQNHQSNGLGAEVLRYAEDLALQNNCKTLRLCAGTENERGIQFYQRNGWTLRAHAFVKKI